MVRLSGILSSTLFALLVLGASSASAETWVVTSAAGSGGSCPGSSCTLSAAAAAASDGDVITFSGDHSITPNQTVVLEASVTLDGGGHAVVLSGGNAHGVLRRTDGSLTVRGLTFINARPDFVGGGGAITTYNAVVTVDRCHFEGNESSSGAGVRCEGGSCLVTRSSFRGNTAIFGAAYGRNADLTITNSSFVENTSDYDAATGDSTLVVRHSTFVNNGGLDSLRSTADSIVEGCIFSNPDRTGGTCYAEGLTASNNLGNWGCGDTPGEARLGTPQFDGPVLIVPLLPGSAAIDAGTNAICSAEHVQGEDVRGLTRDDSCDLGAFESGGFTLSYVSGSDQVTGTGTPFPQPLVAQVEARRQGEPVGPGGELRLSGPPEGASTTPAELIAPLDAQGGVSVTVTANDQTGSYQVSAMANGVTGTVTWSLRNLLGLGATCDTGQACANGQCVDGVCCDSACDGLCERCDSNGACGPLEAGTDPEEECGGDESCGGACDGAGACAFPEEGADCGTCQACDGEGLCVPSAAGQDPGADCGTCEVCDGAGACVAAAEGEDPKDECAQSAVESCGLNGSCDGGGACALYGSGVVCEAATCEEGNAQGAGLCDGAGTCAPGQEMSCGVYACGEDTCRVDCSQDAHCIAGYRCDAGACVAVSGLGDACADNSQCATGYCDNGTCCAGGTCCTEDAQCASLNEAPTCTDAATCSGQQRVFTCGLGFMCEGSMVAAPAACAGEACADGDACTQTDTCSEQGVCEGSDPVQCEAPDSCNGAGVCDPETGECSNPGPGDDAACDDGNPCTVDSCDPELGCTHEAMEDGTPCGDGDACNGEELCQAGACAVGTAPDCDDGNPCTDDACQPDAGCVATPNDYTESCYSGPEGTEGVGACQAGVRVCQDGALSQECSGEIVPEEESCNEIDDDCDGDIDEDSAQGTCGEDMGDADMGADMGVDMGDMGGAGSTDEGCGACSTSTGAPSRPLPWSLLLLGLVAVVRWRRTERSHHE